MELSASLQTLTLVTVGGDADAENIAAVRGEVAGALVAYEVETRSSIAKESEARFA
jgi:hypothetical protein